MKTNKLIFALIVAGFATSTFAVKPIKPPPPPVIAEDVDCDGCVGTTDIEDGAVTSIKLAPGILPVANSNLVLLDSANSLIGRIIDYSPNNGFDIKDVVLAFNDTDITYYLIANKNGFGLPAGSMHYDNYGCDGNPYTQALASAVCRTFPTVDVRKSGYISKG